MHGFTPWAGRQEGNSERSPGASEWKKKLEEARKQAQDVGIAFQIQNAPRCNRTWHMLFGSYPVFVSRTIFALSLVSILHFTHTRPASLALIISDDYIFSAIIPFHKYLSFFPLAPQRLRSLSEVSTIPPLFYSCLTYYVPSLCELLTGT